MNIFDTMPDVPCCPHCGHNGEGLQWSFPDFIHAVARDNDKVQCACLSCGKHGPIKGSYEEAMASWSAGEVDAA